MSAPIIFQWTGEVMTPVNKRFAKECDREFTIGECYNLIVHESRSAPSHRHYFACIYEAWANLPESMGAELPSPEHLRKRMLIEAGYMNTREIIASSKAEAMRLASFIRPMDEYAVVSVSGCAVIVATAKSQSMRAMGAHEFQASKDAVLVRLADLLSVTPEELRKRGEAA